MTAGYPTPQPSLYPAPGQHHGAAPMVRMMIPQPGQMLGHVAVMSQADNQPASNQNMWSGAGGPGGPGQPHQPPPIPATPPQHGTQPSTPAPSPGIQQMYAGPGHHQPPAYPAQQQIVQILPNPQHAAFPGHGVPTSVGPHGPHMAHMMGGPGPGQPVTSMSAGMMQPQFQYMPQQHNQGKLQ